MPTERLSMRKIREVLRLKAEVGLSNRKVAVSCSIGSSTVSDYINRARAAGLWWPLPEGLSEVELERLLFPSSPSLDASYRPIPNWAEIHQELKGEGVTLALLWEEYKSCHPEGYQYSWFCGQYRHWALKLNLSLRQTHKAGEKLFVDYAGQTKEIIHPTTGEVGEAQIFVAVLGASNYTYAEATWTQSLPDWIASHQRAFRFFGGVTELTVPDNLKSGVSKACRYEPDLNPTYQEMASHYSTAVLPARVRKAKDKAKVESGVLVVERWILAALRKMTFFSLDELNQAISELLERLNNRPFKKLPGTRRSAFESLDKPVLKLLPPKPYEYAEWKKAKVNIDYHVEVDGHYYSVPYQLVGKRLKIRYTANTIECLQHGKRVASHRRSFKRGSHTTLNEHMPKSHREYLKWTPDRLLNWAVKTGPATARLAKSLMDSRDHPQQAFRSILGVMRLTKPYGDHRVEAACNRALAINSPTYKSVRSILKTGLDKAPLPKPQLKPDPIIHQNIRGRDYYAPKQEGGQIADQSHHRQTKGHEAKRHDQGPGGTDQHARQPDFEF
jgi:transposase